MFHVIALVLGAVICIAVGAGVAVAVILGSIQRGIGRGLGW